MFNLVEKLSSNELDAQIQKVQIERLQDELLEMPQADIVTEHLFMDGIYERKIIVPAWTVLTGAAHKTDYKIRLEKGTIAVNVGTQVKVLTAPCELNAKAGEQRVGRVFEEEVVWVDIYSNPDNCTNIEILEDRLYVVPDCGLGENRLKLQNNKKQEKIELNGEEMNKIAHINQDSISVNATNLDIN